MEPACIHVIDITRIAGEEVAHGTAERLRFGLTWVARRNETAHGWEVEVTGSTCPDAYVVVCDDDHGDLTRAVAREIAFLRPLRSRLGSASENDLAGP